MVDLADGAAAGAAGCAGGSGVMMLTGGIEAEFAKSTVVGRPVGTLAGAAEGTPGSMMAAGAAALVQDGE